MTQTTFPGITPPSFQSFAPTVSCGSCDSEEDTLITQNLLLNSTGEVGAALLMTEDPLHIEVWIPVLMDSQEFSLLVASQKVPPTCLLDNQTAQTATSKPQPARTKTAGTKTAGLAKRKGKQAAAKKPHALSIMPELPLESAEVVDATSSPSPSSDTDMGLWGRTQTDSSDSSQAADVLADIVLAPPPPEEHHSVHMLRPCVARHPRLQPSSSHLAPPETTTPTPTFNISCYPVASAPSLPLLSLSVLPLSTTAMAVQRANSANSEGMVKVISAVPEDSDSSGGSHHMLAAPAVVQVPAAPVPATQDAAVCHMENSHLMLVQPAVARRRRLVLEPTEVANARSSKHARIGI